MHTGFISFCDRIAYNIKSSDTKDVILQELETQYQIRILSKHWLALNEETIQHVHRAPHFACLRSNGNPYYMYLTKYEDVPIIYYIDKKIQPGYQKPRIILGRNKFDASLFENTLLEGEMVKDSKGKWVFLINDLIAYKNEYLQSTPLPKRLERLVEILDTMFVPDDVMDVCRFEIKQYAYATKDGLGELMQLKEKLSYTNRGIYMWPFFLQYKPKLLNFDETLIKEVHRKVKDTPDFQTGLPVEAAEEVVEGTVVETEKVQEEPTAVLQEGEKTMWLRKTENPDVYDVFSSESCIAKNRQGVAHVSGMAGSKMLRAVFKDLTVAVSRPFVCVFNDRFQKWEPKRVLT